MYSCIHVFVHYGLVVEGRIGRKIKVGFQKGEGKTAWGSGGADFKARVQPILHYFRGSSNNVKLIMFIVKKKNFAVS